MLNDADATLVSLLVDRVRLSGDQPALLTKRDGAFRSETWSELFADVLRTAAALRALGVAPSDRVVQVAENRREWIVLDAAIHLVGGVHVAVHTVLSAPQIAFQIADTEARVVVLSGREQVDKLATIADALPADVRWLTLDSIDATLDDKRVECLPTLAATFTAAAAALADEAHSRTQPSDLATILYSSGTTGEPKGVMLTHGNLASNAIATIEAFDLAPGDVRLCWLPLSHIFARTCDLYAWVVRGSTLALAESREQILPNCLEVRPTVMNGVPYFYDKVMRHVVDRGDADRPGALAELLGGRIRMLCSGGAALADHVADFFCCRGVTLHQGYGLTESSPVITASTNDAFRTGAVGRALRGVEVRIADDGEILTRGPHVMAGYWRRPDLTAEAVRGGWLHTGDLGRLDDDGYLWITGRKKELLVTAAGKNIAPNQIEALLTADPFILQAVVLGDGCNYLAALIVPNPDSLRNWIIGEQIAVTSRAEALAHPRVVEHYRQCIDARLSELSHFEQVARFKLLDRGFTVETGELTATLKLRRSVIAEHFCAEIAGLYS